MGSVGGGCRGFIVEFEIFGNNRKGFFDVFGGFFKGRLIDLFLFFVSY